MQWRNWLSNYATSRQVASSMPDAVNKSFKWPNISSRTLAFESTHSLTEMSFMNLPGGKGRPTRKADNLTACIESGSIDVS
jgi:hypothetical protein